MVEADFSGSYLNAENAKPEDIIVVVGSPENEEKQNIKGDTYIQVNIPVELNGKKKIYSPDRETGKRMVAAWGKEMDNWIGQKAQIKHVLKQIKGKTETYISAYPIEVVKA